MKKKAKQKKLFIKNKIETIEEQSSVQTGEGLNNSQDAASAVDAILAEETAKVSDFVMDEVIAHTVQEVQDAKRAIEDEFLDDEEFEKELQEQEAESLKKQQTEIEEKSIESKEQQEEKIENQRSVSFGIFETGKKETEEEIGESEKPPSKFRTFVSEKKKILLSILAVLLVGLYGYMSYYYSDKFFIGTKVNGIRCGGLTADEVEILVRDKVEKYELSLVFRDGTTEVISGESIEYKYVPDGGVQKALDKQFPLAWIVGVIMPRNLEVAESIEYSKSLLADEYYALESTSEEKEAAPVDSYVKYEGDKFIIVPEDLGNQIDHHAFLLKINEVVSASGTEIIAEECDVYAMPQVYSDAPELAHACEQYNQLAKVSVTYTLPTGTKVFDGNVLKDWLTLDEQGNYSITEEEMQKRIKEYVEAFADEVNTVNTDRVFNATMQGEITVGGGTYGWKVDEKAEIAQLTEEIANHSIVTREPSYTSKEVTTENNGFGNTYIEIDLTNQHLWYYIDGELYIDSDIVSGTYHNKSRRTPPGIFLLTYKQKDRVLRGDRKEDGTYSYESPVSFWMPFNGGIGLHDASWRGRFGGKIYEYSGSHGCINMPYKKAKLVYEKIDKETPIICYY